MNLVAWFQSALAVAAALVRRAAIAQPGGAFLAAATGAPVLVVAHNAGSHWPAHSFRKTPGTITFAIAPAIDTANKTSKQINAEASATMEELTHSLS